MLSKHEMGLLTGSQDTNEDPRMNEYDWLAERFQENRPRLRAVAYRILGSFTEADDAVQESWLRLSRSDAGVIENLDGWLTTVVARVCTRTSCAVPPSAWPSASTRSHRRFWRRPGSG